MRYLSSFTHIALSLFIGVTIASTSSPSQAQTINKLLMSSEPLLAKTNADGHVQGIFADVFLNAAKEANRQVEVTQLPWKRAQKIAQDGESIAIGPLTRNTRRENQYKWIGPLFPFRIVYMTAAGQPRIETLEQARSLKIGIKGGSAAVFAAKKHKIPESQQVMVAQQDLILGMLLRDRIDAWLVWDIIAHRTVQEFSKGAKLQTGYTDEFGDLYLAASPSVPDSEIQIWREALKRVVDRGDLAQITHKYLGRHVAQTP